MLGALIFGCPILFVPQGADQFTNAERAMPRLYDRASAGNLLLAEPCCGASLSQLLHGPIV